MNHPTNRRWVKVMVNILEEYRRRCDCRLIKAGVQRTCDRQGGCRSLQTVAKQSLQISVIEVPFVM